MMKHLSRFLLAALLVVPLVACDEDEGPQQPTEVTGTVRGTVTVEGDPQSGITVQLAGAASQSQTTGSDGSFAFSGVPGGSYSVTLSGGIPNGVEFANQAKTTEITSNGQSVTVDFSGSYIRTASISGTVSAGGPVDGATVTLSGTESATTSTDGSGEYSFSGLRAGNYTVEVSDLPEGRELSTTSKSVTLSAGQSRTVNFSGSGQSTAKVVIESMMQSSAGATQQPIDPSNTGGQIDFTLNVDEGNDDVTRVSILVDGEEVAFQSFSAAGAPAEGKNVAKAPEAVGGEFQVVLSVPTHAIELNADGTAATDENGNAIPLFLDGEHDVTASLNTKQGGESSAQAGRTLTFNNAAGGWPTGSATFLAPGGTTTGNTILTMTTTDNGDDPSNVIGANNLRWYGGTVNITGIPLNYSPSAGSVNQVTVTLSVGSTRTDSDGSDGFNFSFPEGAAPGAPGHGVAGVEVAGVTVTTSSILDSGEPGPGTGPVSPLASGNPFRLDNRGPSFDNLQNIVRVTRWINGEWTFADLVNTPGGILVVDRGVTCSSSAGGNPCGGVAATATTGVGFDNTDITFMGGSSLGSLEEVTSGDDLSESFDPNEYFLLASASDRLGNTTSRYYAGIDDGTDNESTAELGYATATAVSGDATARHGVDKVDPTKALAANSLDDMDTMHGATHPSGVATANGDDRLIVTFQDSRSGFTPTPVFMNIRRAHPTVSGANRCAFGADADPNTAGWQGCDFATMAGTFDFIQGNGNPGPAWTNGGDTDAYYTSTWYVEDEAGNATSESQSTVLLDTQRPSLGGFTIPANLDAGETETISAAYSENIDADEAFFFLEYGDGAQDFFVHLETKNLGEWGPAEFTTSGGLDVTTQFTSHIENNGDSGDNGLDVGAGGANIVADNARFRIFDFAGNLDTRTEALTTVNGSAENFADRDSNPGTTNDNITNARAWMGDPTDPTVAGDHLLCADYDSDGCPTNPTSRPVHLQVMGAGSGTTSGQLDNQFQRVIFVAPMSGPTGGAAFTADPIGWEQVGTGTVSITDDGATRTYTYSGTVDVSDLEVGGAAATTNIWAIGFTKDGANAMMISFNVDLTND